MLLMGLQHQLAYTKAIRRGATEDQARAVQYAFYMWPNTYATVLTVPDKRKRQKRVRRHDAD